MNQLRHEETPPSEQPSVFTAALRIFSVLPKILSVFLSLSVVAYVVGWFEARAYFRAFGAEWLLFQLGPFDLLRFSMTPILFLAVFIWLGLTDLAKTAELKDSRRYRATLFVLRYGWGVLFVLLMTTYSLEALEYRVAAGAFAVFTMVGFVFFAGAVFEKIVVLVQEGRFIGDLGNAGLVYAVVAAGLYFTPTLYGSLEGKAATDPTRSELPIVTTVRGGSETLRLVFLSQGLAYLADLGDGTKGSIKIHVLPISEVQAIMPKASALAGHDN